MSKKAFRLPHEMVEKDNKSIILRVSNETLKVLGKASKKSKGLTVNKLCSRVLDDYAAWLISKGEV